MNQMKGSWRTTTLGIFGLVTLGISITTALIDGNPNTNVDWSLVIPTLMANLSALFARDNKVTSEAAGAKTPPPNP